MMLTQGIAAPGRGPDPSRDAWNDMLAAFHALGGAAVNLRTAPDTGLYAIDPAQPVLLRVPDKLIFPVEDIAFHDGRITFKETTSAGGAEREFFTSYANAFSWGRDGRRQAEAFVTALDALPTEVREILATGFGMSEFLEGERDERARRWYLRSRMKGWKGKNVLIPIVEIANRGSDGLAYHAAGPDCLQLEGRVKDEVLVEQGPVDSFSQFRSTSVAQPQARAYSLPLQLVIDGRVLRIERNIAIRVARGNFQVPVMRRERDELILSHLMIGNPNFPRLSRAIFTALAGENAVPKANEVFDNILFLNRSHFLNLLRALESSEGPMVTTLRRMARYQLETIAHCIGTRDI
jgi:hypothetical protein